MTALDPIGRQRLESLQARYGSERFQDVAPTSGVDPESGLTVTIDAARRVTAVGVKDVAGLRTPERLRTAVRTAFHEADREREEASRLASGERLPADGEFDVATLLGPSRPSRRGIVARARQAADSGAATARAFSLMATGRSRNTYLAVTIGPTGVVEDVVADPEWLPAAQPHYLEAALDEALHEASHLSDGDRR